MPTDRAHYPSGEPGTTGREPFEEPNMQPGSAASRTTAGPSSGLATDAHGGTIARDTGVRDGQVVGLAGPTDSGFGLGGAGTGTGLGSGTGAGLGSGTGTGLGSGTGTGSGLGSGAGAGLGAGAGAGVGAGLAAAGNNHSHSSGQGPHFGEEHSSLNHGGRREHDRTGPLDQEAHKYESTGARGPTTSGAAGTERFDVPSSESGTRGSSDIRDPPHVEQDDSHRKGTGGIKGILGTSDKDFTANPDRRGKGAYHDSDGLFKTNTDGPSGHSALTGREGDLEKNPVAQSKSRQDGQGLDQHGHADKEKPGLVEKIKHAIKKD